MEPRSLHELWALPLVERQAKRVYAPWGRGRADQLARENAAPDFPKVGRFYVLSRTDGKIAIVDPLRPWNDAAVGVYDTPASPPNTSPSCTPATSGSTAKPSREKLRAMAAPAPVVLANTLRPETPDQGPRATLVGATLGTDANGNDVINPSGGTANNVQTVQPALAAANPQHFDSPNITQASSGIIEVIATISGVASAGAHFYRVSATPKDSRRLRMTVRAKEDE